MNFPDIDTVMVYCNTEKYIGLAIESVLNQTYKNFRLLLWNDGSTDNSLKIAIQYANKDKRIIIFNAPHQGCTKARKDCMSFVQSKYFGWVDSDDLLDPSCIEKTRKLLESEEEASYVYTHYLEIDEDNKILRLGNRCYTEFCPKLMKQWFITFHFRLVKFLNYKKVEPYLWQNSFADDYDLCLRLLETGKVCCIKEPLYLYRRHNEQISIKNKEGQEIAATNIAKKARERNAIKN